MDRIDLQVEVPAVPYADLKTTQSSMDSESMRQRIFAAHKMQKERYAGGNCSSNRELSGAELEKHCALTDAEHEFLEQAVHKLGLSARAYTRVLRIGRTIADLSQEEAIDVRHLAEAINFRFLDREDLV